MFSNFQTLKTMGPDLIVAFFIFSVWIIAWKCLALWISAREGKPWWFIGIFIFNTAGILEIIYIIFFSQTGKKYIAGFKKHRAHKKAQKNKAKDEVIEETEDSN